MDEANAEFVAAEREAFSGGRLVDLAQSCEDERVAYVDTPWAMGADAHEYSVSFSDSAWRYYAYSFEQVAMYVAENKAWNGAVFLVQDDDGKKKKYVVGRNLVGEKAYVKEVTD